MHLLIHKKVHTCLLSDTNCVSSCRTVSTPASWEADRDVMSPCSRCMPLGGLRRALSGWWRYWAPMFSFFTGPDRLGVALSELVLLGFCFTACTDKKKLKKIKNTQILDIRLFFTRTFMYNRWCWNWRITEGIDLARLISSGKSWLIKRKKCVYISVHRHTYQQPLLCVMLLTSFLVSISKSLSLPGSPSSISSLLWEEKGNSLMVTLRPQPFFCLVLKCSTMSTESEEKISKYLIHIHETLFPRNDMLIKCHLTKEFCKCQISNESFVSFLLRPFFPPPVPQLMPSFPPG